MAITTAVARRLRLLGALLLLLPWPAAAQPYAYVANLGSDDISVIDTQTDTVVATLAAGQDPDGAAVSADGSRVYIANFASDDLTVVDTATRTVVATIPVGAGPVGVALTSDGTRAFVANRAASSVSIVDTLNLVVAETVEVGSGPNAVAITADDKRIFVTNSFTRFPGQLTIIDRLSQPTHGSEVASVETLEVLRNPNRVAVGVGDRHTYVTNFRSWNVSVLDTASKEPVTTVRIAGKPSGVTVNPNGAFVYVSTLNGDVQVIDTATHRVHTAIRVGGDPYGLATTRRGDIGYVANFADGTVSILDLVNHQNVGTVAVGVHPFAVAVDCRGAACSETPLPPLPTNTATATPTRTATVPTTPTSTPLPTSTRPSPTPAATPAAAIRADRGQAQPGAVLTIEFRLVTALNTIAGTQNEILLDRGLFFDDATWPPCQPSPDLPHDAFFSFPEAFDSPCHECRRARALVIDFEEIRRIPAGATLYSCSVRVDSQTEDGSYAVHVTETAASDAQGVVIPIGGSPGTIQVRAAASAQRGSAPSAAARQGGVSTADATQFCSGGSLPGASCNGDTECPGGMCARSVGVCESGDDDGLLCDCPLGTCTSGVCAGGLVDGASCQSSSNCAGAVSCAPAIRLCQSGIAKGAPCLDDRHCAAATCGVATSRCDTGDFAGFACIDDGDCPFGLCRAVAFPPTPSPTQESPTDRTRKPSATPRPTRTPIPGEGRTRRPSATASPTRATPPSTANDAVTVPPSPSATASATAKTPDDDGCNTSGGAKPSASLVLVLPLLRLLLKRRNRAPQIH
jgi:YVTN family beta-propeller protein